MTRDASHHRHDHRNFTRLFTEPATVHDHGVQVEIRNSLLQAVEIIRYRLEGMNGTFRVRSSKKESCHAYVCAYVQDDAVLRDHPRKKQKVRFVLDQSDGPDTCHGYIKQISPEPERLNQRMLQDSLESIHHCSRSLYFATLNKRLKKSGL